MKLTKRDAAFMAAGFLVIPALLLAVTGASAFFNWLVNDR